MHKKFLKTISREARQNPIGFVADLSDIISVLGLLASFVGIFGFKNSIEASEIDVTQFPIAVKALIIILVAAAIGWGLATTTIWLLKNATDIQIVIGHFLAIACATLLLSSTDFMFGIAGGGSKGVEHLFIIVGVAIAFVLARARYRASAEMSENHARIHSGFLLSFSGFILFVFLISVFGQ